MSDPLTKGLSPQIVATLIQKKGMDKFRVCQMDQRPLYSEVVVMFQRGPDCTMKQFTEEVIDVAAEACYKKASENHSKDIWVKVTVTQNKVYGTEDWSVSIGDAHTARLRNKLVSVEQSVEYCTEQMRVHKMRASEMRSELSRLEASSDSILTELKESERQEVLRMGGTIHDV